MERWINGEEKRESMMKCCVCLSVCMAEWEGERNKQERCVIEISSPCLSVLSFSDSGDNPYE